MTPRPLLLAGLLVAAVSAGWWYSPVSPRTRQGSTTSTATRAPAVAAPPSNSPSRGSVVACQLPPRVQDFAAPLQTPVPTGLGVFDRRSHTLVPLAGFSLDARVLSRRDYRSDRESKVSPTDLALGWGRMREDAVLAHLDISQSARWYHYRYGRVLPIPQAEIDRSAANMHMIPGSDAIASELADVAAGDRVRIDGWLVEVRARDGWRWRSSLSREDTGQGACEIVYVCAITRLRP